MKHECFYHIWQTRSDLHYQIFPQKHESTLHFSRLLHLAISETDQSKLILLFWPCNCPHMVCSQEWKNPTIKQEEKSWKSQQLNVRWFSLFDSWFLEFDDFTQKIIIAYFVQCWLVCTEIYTTETLPLNKPFPTPLSLFSFQALTKLPVARRVIQMTRRQKPVPLCQTRTFVQITSPLLSVLQCSVEEHLF